jgi:hypothetical protein
MRLVPQESCAILNIDWSSLHDDEDLRRLINAKAYEDLLSHLYVSSDSIKSVVVFSGINGQAMSGLLLRGSFDRKEVIAELKSDGWSEHSLESDQVYVKAADYIAIPSNNTLIAGTREGVLAALRAKGDAKESIVTSPAYKKINAALFSGESKPVKAFLVIPQGTLDMADAALTATSFALSFFDLGGIGQLLKAVAVARGFAFTLDHGTDDRYPVEVCVLMRDEEAAVFISGSLNAMKEISDLAVTDRRDQQALREIRKMKITRTGEVLAIRMEMPRSALFPPAKQF